MRSVLILDVETSGLEPPEAVVIEIGAVLWSIEHRAIVECFSSLIPHHENPAEPFNAISEALLKEAALLNGPVWGYVNALAEQADAVIAHSAPFDHKFVKASHEDENARVLQLPWICTLEDVDWPKASKLTLGRAGSGSLVRLAINHGVAVTNAHRSIHDCLLLMRLFEAVSDIDERLEKGLERSQRPKATFIATVDMDRNPEVKRAGFHWDRDRKVWHRYMAVEDAEELPFPVVFEEDYWEQQVE